MQRTRWILALIATLTITPSTLRARDVRVTTAQQLTDAIAMAMPGDVIELAAGTYRLRGVSCSRAGTATAPIVVRSATPLGARIEFDALEGFLVSAPHWQFDGLDVRGVCANDSNCEHAFHVVGAADNFVLRNSRVQDFNAQIKVNASRIGTMMVMPNNGLIEYTEFADTHARNTSNPTTKINIDTGNDWIVRGNYLHDFRKGAGDNISYGAFMKSGGQRGIFERNLVICDTGAFTGGTRIGLSFGGGGTAPQFCAPAYDAATPCAVEHRDGILRNNIIVNCSDVAVYLNRAANTRVLHNTFIATAGVDYRFSTSSGEAFANVLSGRIRMRDGATFTSTNNLENIDAATFAMLYQNPLRGDLRRSGDLSMLLNRAAARAEVTNDYCARTRPSGMRTLGALEHSLGDCDTTRPPTGGTVVSDAGMPIDASTPDTGVVQQDSAIVPDSMVLADVPSSTDSASTDAVSPDAIAPSADVVAVRDATSTSDTRDEGSTTPRMTGCGCRTTQTRSSAGWMIAFGALLLARSRKRRTTNTTQPKERVV